MPGWLRSGISLLATLIALAVLARARGVVAASVQLSAGLLLACAGLGFVLAPLLRRRAGRATAGDRRLLSRRSFLAGLVATLAGLALAGYAVWHLAGEQMSAHALRTFVS